MRFGDFVAVDHVSFRIRRGEIFGFLGSNGCGKTTMKMLTGLLPASEGRALAVRPRRGLQRHRRAARGLYVASFSLYGELTVLQNLVLHAAVVPRAGGRDLRAASAHMAERFGLREERHDAADKLPLGLRQRLSLAVAMVHQTRAADPGRAHVGRGPDRPRPVLAPAGGAVAPRW